MMKGTENIGNLMLNRYLDYKVNELPFLSDVLRPPDHFVATNFSEYVCRCLHSCDSLMIAIDEARNFTESQNINLASKTL